jgi:multidrug resistance efflux pump
MNQTTTKSVPADAHANGARSPLSDRVRSLRLSDGADEGAGRRSSWLPWTICGVLALVSGYLILDGLAPVDEATLKQAVDERLAMVAKDKPGTRSSATPGSAQGQASSEDEVVLDSKGYVTPVHTIQVSPQVTGKLMELTFTEGKLVKTGEVLAVLEKTEYQTYYDNAVAKAASADARWQMLWKYRQDEVKQAEADLEDSKAQMVQLKAKSDRTEQLYRQRSASQEDFEQAYFAYVSRKSITTRLDLAYKLLVAGPRDSQIAAAKAEFEQAKADVVKAKWQLDNCVVYAPVDGTILAKRAEVGNLTNPNAFTTSGQPAGICDLADLADLEVDLSISELDIAKVFTGQACKVRAEAYPGRPYKAFVSRIMPTADRAKAAVSVRVKIVIDRAEAGRYLLPDMGARVSFYNKKA